MLLTNKKTGEVKNITEITINHKGTFDDIVNYRDCKFFVENSDPKEFSIFYNNEIEEKRNHFHAKTIVSMKSFMSYYRYKFKKKGFKVTKFICYLKPKSIIEFEKQRNNFIIGRQKPIKYTIIFSGKTNTELHDYKEKE